MNYRVIFRESIYFTNLLKNFFTVPPDKMRKKDRLNMATISAS